MKAWVCREFKDPFEIRIEDAPEPEPGPDEVKIKVMAAGLTFGEMLVLKGTYQKTPSLPYIPASEMSGIVQACGADVAAFEPGDEVSGFSISLDGGGLAEYAVLPHRYIFPKPARISFAEAAGYPMNYWTAFNALDVRGALKPGEVLVVHGATGGIGVAAVQIGKAMGATVIATGSDDRRLARVKDLGADHIVNLRTSDLRTAVKDLTGGRGADVFLDPVGGDVFEQSMRAIAPGGRILVVGFTSGRPSAARTNVLLVKMISVIGIEARLAIEATGDKGWSDFRRMLDWIAGGKISPHVGQTYEFEDVLEGYKDIAERRQFGKSIVLI